MVRQKPILVEDLGSLSNTWFLGPTRVHIPDQRFLRAYQCVQYTDRQIDRQTNDVTSVAIGGVLCYACDAARELSHAILPAVRRG